MATKFVTNIDLNQNQILNGRLQALASDPGSGNFTGRLIYNTTEDLIKFYDGSAFRKTIHALASNTTALTVSEANGTATYAVANVVEGGASGLMTGADKTKLDNATSTNTNSTLAIRDGSGRLQVSTPAADLDAANKAYVDAARTGLDVKASVRAATTAALTLSSDLENGDTLDGVTLATGDRVLVKNQGTGAENGIYIVAASGAPSRATDADANSEMTPGMFTFVEEGTTNADSGWVMTNDGAITVGTTALTFALFSVAGTIFAGDGLSKSGDVLNVNVSGTGGIEISSDDLQIEIDSGVSGLVTSASGLALKSNMAGDGITFTTGVISLATTAGGAGLTYTSGVLAVGAGDGITINANDVALASTSGGAGLTYTSGVLAVGAGDGITVNADDVALASTSGGAGLTFTSGVLAVGAGDGITINADDVALASTTGGAGLTFTSGVLAVGAGDGITINADDVALATTTGGAGLTFTSGVLAVGAGDGITINANDVALASTTAGTGITFTSGVLSADASDLAASGAGGVTGTLPIANGGTNATTETAARANLAATSASGLTTSTPTTARIASDTIGDGSATAFVITHNLGTRDVVIQVYDAASYDTVIADVVRTSTDTATITFSSVPSSNAYVAVITG
ncbi:MAG: hypothetical protein QF577_06605 [Phycisphaerae bacterium]|jgi:hypothetical protein|nr:hypothetical protein [Phycisphaerae bacterium]